MPPTLDALFAALADPTRRALLARLAAGEATVLELAEPFNLSQPAITKHLKVLEAAGLVSRSREGARRPAHLEAEALMTAEAWIRDLGRGPRAARGPAPARRTAAAAPTRPGLSRPWRRL